MTAAVHLPDKRDWTVDDVASLPEDLHYELINGRLVLSPSPLPFHQYLGNEILYSLRERLPRQFFLATDQSVLVDSGNEPRPDVVVMWRRGATRTPVLAADVLLAVEVVSPESAGRDRRDELKLYAEAGIPAYWIVDPLGRRITFTQFLLGPDGAYRRQLQAEGLVTIDQPWEVTLDLPEWARTRDELGADFTPEAEPH
jgi:Uma2 family endonuclease